MILITDPVPDQVEATRAMKAALNLQVPPSRFATRTLREPHE